MIINEDRVDLFCNNYEKKRKGGADMDAWVRDRAKIDSVLAGPKGEEMQTQDFREAAVKYYRAANKPSQQDDFDFQKNLATYLDEKKKNSLPKPKHSAVTESVEFPNKWYNY